MKKIEVVKDNKRFNEIIAKGKHVSNKFFVIYSLTNPNNTRWGVAVGVKLGKAYLRNKYKRQIRNIIDINKFLFKKNNDYIIIMKKAASNLKFEEMQSCIKSLIEKGAE